MMGGFNIVEKFQQGGWVMWPLLFCAVLAVAFWFERLIVMFIQKRKLKPDRFLEAFESSLKKNNGDKDAAVAEMTALCEKRGGVCAEIMLEGLQKYAQAKTMNMSAYYMKTWLNDAISERARIALPQLEAHLGVLSTVATVSPLMGLLGTVLGMIQSFEVMASAAGGAKPDELAGGISVALITTATGLIIAIPVLIMYNAIRASIENYVALVEEAAIHLVDSLIIEGPAA
jgi:biopolymer transport protein ExbB